MANVIRADLRDWRRTIVLSDVHGHATLLRRMLEELDFSDRDLLIVLGDLILRGRENAAVLRLAMALAERPNVLILGGNCDNVFESVARMPPEERLRVLRGNGFCAELLAPLAPPEDASGDELLALLLSRYAAERAFLAARPDILATPQAVFVHGGLPGGDLADAPGWDPEACRKNDDYLSHAPTLDRPVVVGHWPCALYAGDFPDATPHWDGKKRVLFIDGGLGVKPDGQLNAVVIPEGDFERREYRAVDALPVLRARTAQAPSESSFFLRYGDDRVERLKERDGMTLVRHLRTGRSLWVLNARLWSDERGHRCADSTDYLLPVQPGDELRLVADAARGKLVKKNGVTGWYLGETEESST